MELVTDRERLVAALRERGVDYLTPSDVAPVEPMADELLIASLAAHPDPRLRQALIALFMLQPQLGPLAPQLRNRLEGRAAQELTAYYLAAMYLQRMWRIRLSHYLPPMPMLPEYFSAELGLPSADDEHGKTGLAALAEWHADHSPIRANYLSSYEGVAELLFQRLKLTLKRHEFTAAG